jgi:hypothetical protein
LKNAAAFFANDGRTSVTVFEFIAEKKAEHSVKTMRRVLGVSRSGFTPGAAGIRRCGLVRTPV